MSRHVLVLCALLLARTAAATPELDVLADPLSAGPWVALGDARLAAGDMEQATLAYQRAQALDPESLGDRQVTPMLPSVAQDALAHPFDDELWGDLGDEALDSGDVATAARFYEVARQLDPSDSEWGPKLSDLAHPLGTDGVAVVAAPPFDPSTLDDEALGDHADVLLQAGQTVAACHFYARANQLDPSDGEWVVALGSCPQTPVGWGLPAVSGGDIERAVATAAAITAVVGSLTFLAATVALVVLLASGLLLTQGLLVGMLVTMRRPQGSDARTPGAYARDP